MLGIILGSDMIGKATLACVVRTNLRFKHEISPQKLVDIFKGKEKNVPRISFICMVFLKNVIPRSCINLCRSRRLHGNRSCMFSAFFLMGKNLLVKNFMSVIFCESTI